MSLRMTLTRRRLLADIRDGNVYENGLGDGVINARYYSRVTAAVALFVDAGWVRRSDDGYYRLTPAGEVALTEDGAR
jgi:hypothetical protein